MRGAAKYDHIWVEFNTAPFLSLVGLVLHEVTAQYSVETNPFFYGQVTRQICLQASPLKLRATPKIILGDTRKFSACPVKNGAMNLLLVLLATV